MAAHAKAEALATIDRDGVVPVFYDPDIEVTKAVARRLLAGGIPTMEFTNRGDGAISVLAELIGWARRELPGLAVGVGSVIEATTAGHVIDWRRLRVRSEPLRRGSRRLQRSPHPLRTRMWHPHRDPGGLPAGL